MGGKITRQERGQHAECDRNKLEREFEAAQKRRVLLIGLETLGGQLVGILWRPDRPVTIPSLRWQERPLRKFLR